MHVLAPDLLADVSELSPAITATGLALGLSLWLFGWKGHRFWIVLAATLAGGIAGLSTPAAYGIQPLVAGLLAAVAAGVLALALVRVIAFAAGGLLACLVVHLALPSWEQPLLTGLVGGLIGVFLFRFWTMVLTSMAGTLLSAYGTLALLHRFEVLDAVSWADQHNVLLNWLWGALSLLGLLVQFVLERRRIRLRRLREEKSWEREAARRAQKPPPPAPKRTLWNWVGANFYRQAG
jgi:MFS family permease